MLELSAIHFVRSEGYDLPSMYTLVKAGRIAISHNTYSLDTRLVSTSSVGSKHLTSLSSVLCTCAISLCCEEIIVAKVFPSWEVGNMVAE